jgi:tetratricopeptide (TPR) repeat protein
MSKSIVEKYEQMLSQDPTSTVFVELARAYLERGDHARAVTVCEQGVGHHPNSIAGRVLWGKALINLGKAAEAMKQFDLAVSIDRENPHAYNLISEALLRKGLFRSALPILRKAAALQPNDARIAQWFEQTRAALAGGPAPVLYDSTTVGLEALGAGAPVESAPGPAVAAPAATAEAEATVVTTAYAPEELPVVAATLDDAPAPASALPAAPDPFATVPSRSDATDTFRGLTNTFDALAEGASASIAPPPSSSPSGVTEPTVIPSADLLPPPPPASSPSSPGLLEDVVSAQAEVPAPPPPPPEAPPRSAGSQPPMRSSPSRSALLEDIPEEEAPSGTFEPPSSLELPRVELNPQATEAIAREYEQELREKLEAARQKQTFVQRHGVKLVLAAVLLVLVGGLGGSYLYTSIKNKGETLQTAIGKGISGVSADTKEQYEVAVRLLDQALSMESGNVEALAHKGYAQALLFAEHGQGDAARQSAVSLFQTPKVRAAHPDFALVVDALTAGAGEALAARQLLLGSDLSTSVIHAEAGRRLLEDKKYDEALARLKRAIDGDGDARKIAHVRALVALGGYYRVFEDWDNALAMFSRAEALSRFHPERVVGHAEARLALGREQVEALSDLEGLTKSASVPEALQGRYALTLGRALSANGRHVDALKALADGQAAHPQLAFDYAEALGRAYRAAGKMSAAQEAFEHALKLDPASEAAKEGLGRVLLDRSRERELLDRLKPERDARKVALLRGIAWWRLGDPKRARSELSATQVSGKVPAEAAVYLALSDAAEESQADKSIELLQKLAASSRRNKATVQVALARVYMQRNMLDKAKAELEEAAKDPNDYEGNALLGELLLSAGLPPEVALEPLLRVVERNGSHAPSRHLVTRALLALGRTADAVAQVEAWTVDNPGLELAWRDAALAYLEAGRLAEADAATQKLAPDSTDVEAWRVKARVLFARGDSKGAMVALERANKLNPRDADTFCEIGNAFVRQGNGETAPRAYEAALREDPKSLCGVVGPLHAKPGTAKGKDALTALLARSPSAWDKAFLQATLARVLLEERDLRGATTTASDATQTLPTSPYAWYAVGEVARKANADQKARDAFQKAVELDGSWSQARIALAEALVKAGGEALPRALEQYEAVLGIDQNEGDLARVRKAIAALKSQLGK